MTILSNHHPPAIFRIAAETQRRRDSRVGFLPERVFQNLPDLHLARLRERGQEASIGRETRVDDRSHGQPHIGSFPFNIPENGFRRGEDQQPGGGRVELANLSPHGRPVSYLFFLRQVHLSDHPIRRADPVALSRPGRTEPFRIENGQWHEPFGHPRRGVEIIDARPTGDHDRLSISAPAGLARTIRF